MMPWKPSRRFRRSTKEKGEDTETTWRKPIPCVVIVPSSNPPALTTATQTSQHLQQTMYIDEISVDNSIQSTEPLKMVIPKPLKTLMSFWAWVESKFQPFYSDELRKIVDKRMRLTIGDGESTTMLTRISCELKTTITNSSISVSGLVSMDTSLGWQSCFVLKYLVG